MIASLVLFGLVFGFPLLLAWVDWLGTVRGIREHRMYLQDLARDR
jgi:Sec-independent protein secretion pathway component TatC